MQAPPSCMQGMILPRSAFPGIDLSPACQQQASVTENYYLRRLEWDYLCGAEPVDDLVPSFYFLQSQSTQRARAKMPPKPSKEQIESIEQLQKLRNQTRPNTGEVLLQMVRQQLQACKVALASRGRPLGNEPDPQRLSLEHKIKILKKILADNEPQERLYALERDTQRDIDRSLEVAKSTGEFPDTYRTQTLPQMHYILKARSEVDLHIMSLCGKELMHHWPSASWSRRRLLVQRFMTTAPQSCMRMVRHRFHYAAFGFWLFGFAAWKRRQ